MIPLIITASVAIIYAIIRAKHDTYLSHEKWKIYAFMEGIFIDLVVVGLTVFALRLSWYQIPGLAMSFAFIFWIVFDCFQGWLRTGSILYIGTTGLDLKVRNAIHYDTPFWGIQNPKALKYLLWKLFVSFIVIGGTISIIHTYG